MLKNYLGIINLNENELNILPLAKHRTIASIPIAGRYRVIDFILSNMVNADINKIGVFTHNRSKSIIDHLNGGKPWDLDRKNDGLFIFNFSDTSLYYNDIHALRKHLDFLYLSKQEYVILSSSYMIANIDFKEVCKYHEQSMNDISILYTKSSNCKKEFLGCDTLNLDENNTIVSVGKNSGSNQRNNISMEIFILKKKLLIDLINETYNKGNYTRIKDAIYHKTEDLKIRPLEYKGYVKCINSISSYRDFHSDCLEIEIRKKLFYKKNFPIYTKIKDEVPTKYGNEAVVVNSLISNGCVIEGTVIDSVISRNVTIKKGSLIENAIIQGNVVIEGNCHLKNIIIDKNTYIERNKILLGDQTYPIIIEKGSNVPV